MLKKRKLSNNFKKLNDSIKYWKNTRDIWCYIIPFIPFIHFFVFDKAYSKKISPANKFFAINSSIIYFTLSLAWFINLSDANAKKLSDAKEYDYEVFKKYATEQNIADYKKLEELKINELKNNAYYTELLKLYESKYNRALDSIKCENNIH